MKSYSKLLILLISMHFIYFSAINTNAQQIVQIEFFVDSDPGFGNGAPIAITPDSVITNLNASIHLLSIPNGLHTLFLRSKNSLGDWSFTSAPFIFYKVDFPVINPWPSVVRMEYFIDADPGFGNGINIPITSDTVISNLSNSINLFGLTSGIHTLSVRSIDSLGSWSHTYFTSFDYCPGGTSYFYQDLDHDGYGTLADSVLACTVPVGYADNYLDCNDASPLINPGASEICDGLDNDCDGLIDSIVSSAYVCGMAMLEGQSFTLTAPPGNVFTAVDFASYGTPNGTCGNFTLGGCHASNTMSIIQGLVIGQNSVTLAASNLLFGDPCAGVSKRLYVQASYNVNISLQYPFFADSDGDNYGSGNPVILCALNANTPPAGYSVLSTDCDDNNPLLQLGFPFYLDSDGDGYGAGAAIVLCAPNALTPPTGYSINADDCDDSKSYVYPGVIEKLEYFLDTDPAPGMGIHISIPSATNYDSTSVSFSIPVSNSLSPGVHKIASRVYACKLGWGLYEHRSFYVTPADIRTGPLVIGELFFDTDPGMGNGIPFAVPVLDTVNQTLPVSIPLSTIPGPHLVGIRVKDSLGQWSHFYNGNLTVLPPALAFPRMVAAEYFIDNDPGPGNGISLVIAPSDTLSQTFTITVPSNMNEGHHLLSIRMKDSSGNWGLFENRLFYVDNPGPTYNPIVAAEYFVDTDPGVGNATAIVLNVADTVDQAVSLSIPSALLTGNHKLAIRVKNLEGKWSLFERPSALMQVKAYLQGYYAGQGTMHPVLMNQGQANGINDVDSVWVDVHQPSSPYSLLYSTPGVLQTDGIIAANLPSTYQGNAFYIALRHRNTIKTWSANPVFINLVDNLYNFSTDANKAYGNNMVEMEAGVWALYSGDINQDQNIDLLDNAISEIDINNFEFGYFATDINGDGNVDLLDNVVLEININNFIFSQHP
jgi:hypothetical protein